MAMEEALVARLCADATIAGIVGTRVSWFELPREGGLPSVLLTSVTPGREWTMDGPSGLDLARVQIDCWSLEDDTLATLKNAVKAEMETLVPVTASGWIFHPGFLQADQPLIDEMTGGTEVFRWLLEFEFYHQSAS